LIFDFFLIVSHFAITSGYPPLIPSIVEMIDALPDDALSQLKQRARETA
jgi:hypothetical protein